MRRENMKDSLAMFSKTNGGEMSVSASLAMLMKRHGLLPVSRDVDEKKTVSYSEDICALGCGNCMGAPKLAMMHRSDICEILRGE